MLEFVQEVTDFKSYIHGYQCKVATRLIGLGQIHFLKFYVNLEGWPVMKYKESVVDNV
jgi:hypothetical protein